MPRISVIIPNYNRAGLVVQTVENMLSQTLPPHEVIVVDDGSTDDSVEQLGEFGDRIRVVRQSNQGPGPARNAGLRLATGELIQLMDSDDLGTLNKLEVQADLLEREGADLAFCPWARGSIEGNHFSMRDPVLQQAMPPSTRPLLDWFMSGWSTVFQTFLCRADFLRDAGEFRTDMKPAEDSEYFVRLLLKRPRIAFSDKALTLYRLHEQHKLTESGTTSVGRLVDWAKFLHYSLRSCREAQYQFGRASRWNIRGMVDRTYRKLEKAGLGHEARTWLDPLVSEGWRRGGSILTGLELWGRVGTNLRVRRTGTSWGPAYQVGALRAQQRELIEGMGFKLTEWRKGM